MTRRSSTAGSPRVTRTRPGALSMCAAFALLAAATVPALAQEQAAGLPRWSMEATTGIATLEAADLNAFSRHREVFYSTYYEALFAYYRTVYGQAFTSSITKDGELPLLSRGWLWGASASYRVTKRVAATVGVDYFSQVRSGTAQRGHESTLFNPNAVSFETTDGVSYQFAPLALSARSVAALAGLRLGIWNTRSIGLEGLLQAGPARASCRIEEQRATETTHYRTRSLASTVMEGSGWGISAEAGVRAQWRPVSRWGFFFDASYQYRRIGTVNGTMSRASTTRDGDAGVVERATTGAVSGRWQMATASTSGAFGTFSQAYPTIGGAQNRPFALDLSGVRLKAGLAFRFGRSR